MHSKLSSRAFRKWRWLALLLIAVLIAGAGYRYYGTAAQGPEEPTIQIAVVRQGDLVLFASGSGSVIPASEVNLGFGASGTVADLLVEVGDVVRAGDILAVQGDRAKLEAAVASDQLAVLNAQAALDDLYEEAELVAARAQVDLANAQDELLAAEYTWQARQEGFRASELTIQAAEAELVLAEKELDRARSEFDKYSGRSDDDPSKALALTKVSTAQAKYDSALRNLNWYTGQPTEGEQAMLDADLALAQANLAEAERAHNRVKDGPEAEAVATAELQLAVAQANLAAYEEILDKSMLVAPMDATVTAVSAQVGEVASGPFITLADLSRSYLEIFLDETDLGKIDLNYEVEVVLDALSEQAFTGRVVRVDPSLVTASGVSMIRGIVVLEGASIGGLGGLPIGLNASVDVIAGRAEDTLLVPVEALRELDPGEYAVFVMVDGQPKLRLVEVGLMDFSFAEILSGLELGEVVTTGLVETQG